MRQPKGKKDIDVYGNNFLLLFYKSFPKVILETAKRKSVVTIDSTGAFDSVLYGQTSFIIPIGNSAALVDKMIYLLSNSIIAWLYGEAARKRLEVEFQSVRIWQGLD